VLRASMVLLVLALVGCSDDAPPPDERPDRASVERGLADLYAGDHATTRDKEAGACFAEALVDRAGVPALVDAGIVTDTGEVVGELPTFDTGTATLWVDAQFACVDYVEESTRALLAQTKGALDEQRYAECLRAALTESELRAAVAASLTGAWDAPEVTALADAQAGCQQRATPG
jgi:hypothetical protein